MGQCADRSRVLQENEIHLKDDLVLEGVWIEVTNRTEWNVREKRDD
jgi:hypothetical protein